MHTVALSTIAEGGNKPIGEWTYKMWLDPYGRTVLSRKKE